MKTVAYIRVSTRKQELESQKLAILEFCQREKIQVDDFVEITISSRKQGQRKHFGALVADLAVGDTLIVSELSRIGRSLGAIIKQVDALLEKKVNLIAIKENIRIHDGKQDIQTKLMVSMFGILAEIERDLISERTKEGLALAKKKGKKLGRPKGRGKSKLDGREKEIAEYLDKGVSKASIAKILGVAPNTLSNFIKSRELEMGDLLKGVR